MKTSFLTTSTLAASLFLVACGKSPDDVKQEAQNKVVAAGNPAIQNGTYATECNNKVIDSNGVKIFASKTVYELSDPDFRRKEINYLDSSCTKEAYVVWENGKIEVTGKSASEANALDMNFKFDKTYVHIADETLVKVFNVANLCGHNNWGLGEERKIEVSPQANQIACPGKPSPRTILETVLVENNTLFVGSPKEEVPAGVQGKDRPTKVDRTLPMRKL